MIARNLIKFNGLLSKLRFRSFGKKIHKFLTLIYYCLYYLGICQSSTIAQYSKYHGGPLALEIVAALPMPTPNEGEILVKVECSSVNVIDWKIQDGLMNPFVPQIFPHIPGTDISGKVVSIGPGVVDFAPGDKVISCLDLSKGGAYAEYALASVTSTVKRPPNISLEIAASLPMAGMTTLQSAIQIARLKFDGLGPTLNILITAASGEVGLFWIQIAKLGGCFVTATCGAHNIGLLRGLGADEVLDYKTKEGESYKSPSGKKYDVVVHLASYQPMKAFKSQLTKDGMVIDMTPTMKTWIQNWYNKVTFSRQSLIPFMLNSPNLDYLQTMTDLVEDGKLTVVLDSIFVLDNASNAWARSIGGDNTGKIVLIMKKSVPSNEEENVQKNRRFWEYLETLQVDLQSRLLA